MLCRSVDMHVQGFRGLCGSLAKLTKGIFVDLAGRVHNDLVQELVDLVAKALDV